ncbi:16S rRNA (guanine(527)-N(7))-methyltransferase RsmG [Billgrantia tianxiuensis]|jgi:16S rRNA (guanine527-N7)-methyltransferase|uniref:Ribosomal RNA small subunit methyltransferase G n=1 Tax=Billgrantia tianxiuensis TaxID=2497861 RepID=A0A6I6SV73_9GAMM|nr:MULTISPECIES: 16S rRNA (guanine(527)-N(7))-methyltransferase RsmG [Halomonas]MCE8035239.1 16S rRNA (guanine(527)-N(7))-methyltransferase RsmG [Halomonas sp. MCCC 1A11057]QHC51945.1 16S rRNA (guanine(527)-N(7))-methyltransferase RsmG [Halomonas tianxiuensis]
MSDVITSTVTARLDEGLAALGLDIDGTQRERLLRLVGLLHKWNRAYNLTAIRSPEEMVTRHVLDSAAVLPFVDEGALLDVGAGPGLPGLVLAILEPGLSVTLLDSNGKKVRFQRQAVLELGLANATPVQARVEAFAAPEGGYAQVISRAFASLADFVRLTDHLVAPGGRWLAMKGPAADEELADLDAGLALRERHMLAVPFTAGERQLLIVERTDSNPGRQ